MISVGTPITSAASRRRHQFLNGLSGRNQNLAAEVSAFFCGRKLIFEVNAGCARFDHAFHQFESVQGAAKAGLGIGNQRREPSLGRSHFAFRVVNLVRALQRIVDAPAKIGNAVGGVQALVRIHGAGIVGVGGDLPSTDVDRFQACLNLLHGLISCHGPQCVDVGVGLQKFPQTFRSHAGQRVLDENRAAKTQHIF